MTSLTSVLDIARPYLPVAAVGLMVLLLILLGLVIRLWRLRPPTAAEPASDPLAARPGGNTGPGSAGMVRIAGVHLERLTSVTDGAYGVPWIALIGTPGAATDGLLPDLLANSPDLPALRRLLQDDGGRVAFCREGVVMCCEPSLLDRRRWLDRWRATVRAARICRPERPLDALVVAVSAAELRDPDQGALIARGEQIYLLLAALQRDTGWRVPVTLVVTGCESLVGFETLATALPGAARHQPLGWASPYALDTAFEPGWAREAMSAVIERMTLAQLTLSADTEAPARASELLTLTTEIAALEPPLTALLTSAIRGSAYHESFMFRGLFLAGAMPGAAAEAAGSDSVRLAFGPAVLTGKVFPEHRLAQPALGEATRRHRQRRWARASFAAIALLCGVGLLRLNSVSQRDFGGVLALMQRIMPHDGTSPPGGPDTADRQKMPPELAANALAVMQAMGDLTTNSIEIWAVPLSTVSGADAQVRKAIARGWENSVLSAFARGLEDAPTVARRLDIGPSVGAAPDLDALAGRIIVYDDMVARYRKIGRGTGVDGIESLASYVFNVVLPLGFRDDYDLYIDALTSVRRPRVDLVRAQNMVQIQFDQTLHRIYAEGRLASAVKAVAERLDRLAGTSDADLARPLLRELSTSLDALAAQVSNAESGWVLDSAEPAAVGDALARLSSASRADNVLTPDFVANLHSHARTALNAARHDLLAVAMPDSTPILTVRDGKLTVTATLAAAREPLAALVARSFMSPIEVRGQVNPPPPGRRLEWTLAPLETAQSMTEAYLAAVPAALRALPEDLRPAVEAVAAAQLGLHVDALVRQGLRPGAGGAADDGAMQAEIANFAAASPLLSSVRDMLREARLSRPATWIDTTVTGQASRLLGEVDSRLAAAAPYQLADPTLAFWSGSGAMAAPAFGAASIAELVSTLPPRHDYIERLARDQAAPLVAWLRDPAVPGTAGSAAMAQRWQAIIDTIDRYHRGDPSNALSLLEQFIAADMDRIANAGCTELPPAPTFGMGNYFATQLQTIRYAVAVRCRLVTRNVAIERYRSLVGDFQADLAGRLPFVRGGPAVQPAASPGQGDRVQADPNDVRRFFQAYGADLPSLRDQLPNDPAYAAPRRFIGQLIAVQESLAPLLLDSSPQAALAYDVSPAFYANAAWSQGIDQLIEMDLAIGERHLSSREPPGSLPWVAGQKVAVTLRWAANGPNVPVSNPAGSADGRAGNGRPPADSVRFTVEGAWSLLDLLRRHAPTPAEAASLGDRTPEVALFDVPLRPNPAALGRREPASPAEPGSLAHIFLRIGLAATIRVPGQPARRIPVSLADFPAEAPPLPDSNLHPPMVTPPTTTPTRPGPLKLRPVTPVAQQSDPDQTGAGQTAAGRMTTQLSAGNGGTSDAP